MKIHPFFYVLFFRKFVICKPKPCIMKKIILLFSFIFVGWLSYAQIAYTSFEEPAAVGGQYTDTGDASTAHDLVNNNNEPLVDFTSSGGEIGFNARYVPYDTPGVGLTDGDYVGVTTYTGGGVGSYPDGSQGYQISDTDGNFILEFDVVDLSGYSNVEVMVNYFIRSTGYEGDGTVNDSGNDRMRIYIKDLTNNAEIDILNTTGNDINDLGIEGVWQQGIVPLPDNIQAQLVVEVRTNGGSEALFLDHIVFDQNLSVNANDFDKFKIYPNPVTSDFVYINSELPGQMDVSIYDLLGNEVLSLQTVGNKINISSLNEGIYIIKITQEGTTSTRKLIVK